jgi:hypothetical protein
LTLIGELFATIPHLYAYSVPVCEAAQFFHFYFSLANIVVLTLLVESHRSSLLEDFFRSRQLILKYGLYLIVLFPLITILPFTDGGYGLQQEDDNQGFCVPSFNRDAKWELSIFFVWVWLLMIVIACLMALLQYRLYRSDKVLAKNLFSTIGLYVIVGILSWIPRSFERMARYSDNNAAVTVFFIAYFPVNISGVLYTIIFLYEQRSLERLHAFPDEVGDLSFTWEKSEILDLIRNSQTDAIKTSFSSMFRSPSMIGARPTIVSIHNPIISSHESSRDPSRQSEMINFQVG